MGPSAVGLATLLALAAPDDEVPPERPLVFVADLRMGMEPGVRTAHALGRVAFAYDDALARAVRVDETHPLGKAAGVGGRLAKGVFVDIPLMGFQITLVHEVMGHGARARELDLGPTYTFRLVPPYRRLFSGPDAEDADEGVATTLYEPSGVLDEDLAVRLAGIEAGYASVWWLQADMAQRGGWVHHRDLLAYGMYRLHYVTSLAVDQGGTAVDPASSNDVRSYLTAWQLRTNRWRPEDRQALGRALQVGYLVGLADPLLWVAAYQGVVGYGWHGKRDLRLPLPQVGDWTVLPTIRYGLTPFGPEHGLELFAGRGDVLLQGHVRAATGGVLPAVGAGARAFGLPVGHGRRLGAELDLWWQPDLMFERRHVFDRPQQLGAQAGLHVDWPVTDGASLVGKLAYKTEGYVLAQPLAAGPVSYLGLSITPR